MPAPSERHDPQVEQMVREYDRTALYLTGVLATLAVASTPSAIRRAQELLSAALQALLAASVAWIGLQVPVIYRGGVEDAIRVLDSGASDDEIRRQADEATREAEHREAMQALAESLRDDLQGAAQTMGRDAQKAMNDIRRRRVSEALAKGSPLSPAEPFREEMRERGVAFTDRRGRRWDAGAYARMALRTHVAAILNAGHLNKALEMGSLYVRVFDGGPGDVDEPCQRANGQVWHVLFAVRNPLEHPNCRRSFAALGPSYDGPVDRGAEEARAA